MLLVPTVYVLVAGWPERTYGSDDDAQLLTVFSAVALTIGAVPVYVALILLGEVVGGLVRIVVRRRGRAERA